MEIAEPCCGARYKCCGVEEGEELPLTPHHTPSQSFDFIVWEKAYLDSIPAADGSSSINICSSISKTSKEETSTLKGNFAKGSTTCDPHMCTNSPCYNTSSSKASTHIPHPARANYLGASLSSSKASIQTLHPSRDDHLNDKETRVPFVHSNSSQNDPTLMSCRTDADLPSSLFDYKPRISDGGFTSLEEAVRRYAERHPQVIMPSPSRRSKELHRTTCTTYDRLNQFSVNHEALLKRSFSQPGGGGSRVDLHAAVGFSKPTSKNSLAPHSVFGHPRIHHDQCNARPAPAPLAQNCAKMSCFPTSPGRRKHGKSTPDDHKSTGIKKPSLDPHLWQEKYMCNHPTLNIHLQPQDKLMCPMTTWTDVVYMPAAGRPIIGRPTPLQDLDHRDSFSDLSSPSSSNYDHHAAAPLNMSKLKLWGLHHRFKALCKKLCSTF